MPSAKQLFHILKNNKIFSDIILFQEIPLETLIYLKHKGGYNYSIHSSELLAKKKYKTGILSRFKIQNSSFIQFKERTSGAILAKIEINKTTFNIACTHFDYIRHKSRTKLGYVKVLFKKNIKILFNEIFKKTVRLDEAKILLNHIGRPGKNTIIAGDFNTIEISSAIRYLLKFYDDAFFMKKDMFTGTYKKINSFIKPKIDFIFHSKELIPIFTKVIQETPGDHYPVMAIFKI